MSKLNNNKVVILLSTYNGEEYLQELLDSIYKQTYSSISVFVRDDGSTDGTIDILKDNKKIQWIKGHNIGYVKSFLWLIYNAPPAPYYMLCDQDDIWMPDKVESAINRIGENNKPAVYSSNVIYCDKWKKSMGESHLFDNNTIWKALLYNQAIGCTIGFNGLLMDYLRLVPEDSIDASKIYSHDAWIFRVCIAVGGESFFDKKSHILYRQHCNNVIGGSGNVIGVWINRLKSVRNNKGVKRKLAQSLEIYYANVFPSDEIKDAVHRIAFYSGIKDKLSILTNKEIYQHSLSVDMALVVAVFLNIV